MNEASLAAEYERLQAIPVFADSVEFYDLTPHLEARPKELNLSVSAHLDLDALIRNSVMYQHLAKAMTPMPDVRRALVAYMTCLLLHPGDSERAKKDGAKELMGTAQELEYEKMLRVLNVYVKNQPLIDYYKALIG